MVTWWSALADRKKMSEAIFSKIKIVLIRFSTFFSLMKKKFAIKNQDFILF
jgi:hypothetical protein